MSERTEMGRQAETATSFNLRYAVAADATLLAELATHTFHQAFDGTSAQENVDGYINDAFQPALLAAELADDKTTYVIAESGSQAVGYLKLYEGDVPECVGERRAIEISRLYVRQEFWAQKIGAALMQRALDEGRQKGYGTVFLGVWEHNERAKAFYRKWGFQQVGNHIFHMGDDPQTDWLMARKL